MSLRLFSKSKDTLSANHKAPSGDTHLCEVQLSGSSWRRGKERARAQLAPAAPRPLLGSAASLWRGCLSSMEAQTQGKSSKDRAPTEGRGTAPLRVPWFRPVLSTHLVSPGNLQAPLTAGGIFELRSFREASPYRVRDGPTAEGGATNGVGSGAGAQIWASATRGVTVPSSRAWAGGRPDSTCARGQAGPLVSFWARKMYPWHQRVRGNDVSGGNCTNKVPCLFQAHPSTTSWLAGNKTGDPDADRVKSKHIKGNSRVSSASQWIL